MDGQCIVDGQVNKDDACYFCNSTLSPTSWSVHSAGYIGKPSSIFTDIAGLQFEIIHCNLGYKMAAMKNLSASP